MKEYNEIISSIQSGCDLSFVFVTTLLLCSMSLNDDQAKLISHALKRNKIMKRLSLFDNQIGDEGAKWISNSLQTNSTLIELDLSENKISSVPPSIATNLKRLNLRGNPLKQPFTRYSQIDFDDDLIKTLKDMLQGIEHPNKIKINPLISMIIIGLGWMMESSIKFGILQVNFNMEQSIRYFKRFHTNKLLKVTNILFAHILKHLQK